MFSAYSWLTHLYQHVHDHHYRLCSVFPSLFNPPPPPVPFRLTCKQMATFTLQPKVVLTARGERPKSLKIFEKDWVRDMRGLSSATTMHVRTQDRLTFRSWRREATYENICQWLKCRSEETGIPAAPLSENQGPWCTSPSLSRSRR